MKILVLAITLSTILISCGSTEKNSNTTKELEKNAHTLLFFDKTQSVDINNSFVKNKYEGALKNIIDQNINTAGDVLEIYYIHENTAKAKCLSMVTRTEKESTEGLNVTDLEASETNYKMSIQKERKMMLTMAIQKMNEKNTGSSNLETNVSASVQVLAAALENKKNVMAYFFSDMIESVKTGRDFHKMAPISHDQAQEWATNDVESKKLYNLAPATITMILPFEPTSSSKENNPNVTDYWKVYFEALGIRQISEI